MYANDGEFIWGVRDHNGEPYTWIEGAIFDPIRPASDQDGPLDWHNGYQLYLRPQANLTPGNLRSMPLGRAGEVLVEHDGVFSTFEDIPQPFAFGEVIGADSIGETGTQTAHLQDPPSSTAPTTYFLEEGAYYGLELNYKGSTHYGWIQFELLPVFDPGAFNGDIFIYNPVAWGWETTPNTPIAAGVPTPGAAALLAIAGLAVTRRRR